MDRKKRVLLALGVATVLLCMPEAIRFLAERVLEVVVIVHLGFEAFTR
jgi:hypothetical protein